MLPETANPLLTFPPEKAVSSLHVFTLNRLVVSGNVVVNEAGVVDLLPK